MSKTLSKQGESVVAASNGYGFVKFSTKEEVEKAIKLLNKSKITDTEIVVEQFDWEKKAPLLSTNIYVKDFPDTWTEEDLRKTFSTFGELGSVAIMKDLTGKTKGFGFVCFKTMEAANKSLEMHGKEVQGSKLYVVWA